MKPATKLRLTAPQALLILAAGLSPVFGGYVASDATKIGSEGVLGAMGNGQAPVLQHALLALPVFVAMILILVGRRVQQIPHPNVAAVLVLLVASLGPAVAISSYRAVSINVWIEWAAYAVAFLAAVGGLGRRTGPVALLGAVAVGTAWIARIGLLEYLGMRGGDPSWRVFCNWNNPNAAAGMLVLGFLCAMGLPRARERTAELLLNLGVVVGGGFILCALFLTGSRGGTLIALPTGLVLYGLLCGRRHPSLYPVAGLVLALSALAFRNSLPALGIGTTLLFAVGTLAVNRTHVGRMLGAFAFGGLTLAFFAATTPKGPAGVTGFSRVSAAAATSDQSAKFRLNLWKTAVDLGKSRPVTGWGLGSYRYESTRPGLVTSTIFAHSTYLQLFAEAGVVALSLLLVFFGLWARRAFRGSSRLPQEGRLAFGAATGGVAAVLAHSLVDSDLSTFGLGLVLFLVLGAATLLAADAVAPEFIPRNTRLLGAIGVAALGIFFLWLANGDLAKSTVRAVEEAGAPADVSGIESLAGWDGDATYLWALAQPDKETALKRAFELLPTPKVGRYLAQVQAAKGEYSQAESSLFAALVHDPNNLRALYLLMKIQGQAGEPQASEETARRLVGIEGKPVFQVRALDQLVPTETYLARIEVLAPAATDPAARNGYLVQAVRGLRSYAEITAPEVAKAIKVDPQATYAGETPENVRKKMGEGIEAARQAAEFFRAHGDATSAAEMDEDAKIMERAIAELLTGGH